MQQNWISIGRQYSRSDKAQSIHVQTSAYVVDMNVIIMNEHRIRNY